MNCFQNKFPKGYPPFKLASWYVKRSGTGGGVGHEEPIDDRIVEVLATFQDLLVEGIGFECFNQCWLESVP